MSMVNDLLGSHYFFTQLFVSPTDVGHRGVARNRTYIICHHKTKTEPLLDVHEVYRSVTDVLKGSVATEPQDYMVSPKLIKAHFNMGVCQSRGISYDADPWLVCNYMYSDFFSFGLLLRLNRFLSLTPNGPA